MESLFNNKFMIKLQNFGQKLGTNKFLNAIQGAMMSVMGILMVAAIFQIICAVGPMIGLFETGGYIYKILYMPYNYTMNCLSLWVVIIMSFTYAKNLKMKSPLITVIQSTVCFLIATGAFTALENGTNALAMSYLGTAGMFTVFIVVFITVQIEKLCIDKNICIKMPDVCPPFLVDGFTSILPLLFNIIFFMVISLGISNIGDGTLNLASGIMAVLATPLNILISVPGMFVIGIFVAIMWCFGIHGSMIVSPIIMPMMMAAFSANAAHAAAGEALVFFPVTLYNAVSVCGGTGNTWPLALFGLRSKSKQIRAVAKAGVIPGWFRINEPITFGMPIMYNPILCIPYILNIPVVMLFFLIGYKTGIIIPAWIPIMSMLPIGFAQYLGTLNWVNAIWDYLMLIPSGLIYYPFFKVYERQLVAKENEASGIEA